MEENRKDEEKRKQNGAFIIIVVVATLIVAIIGASFAYFSAQASSNEGAINLTAHEFTATLDISELYTNNKDLIPVDPDGEVEGVGTPYNTNFEYALNYIQGTKDARTCEDSQGYKICAFYQLTITNDGDTALTLNGSIITNGNEAAENGSPFSNLTYMPVGKNVPENNRLYAFGTPITLVQTPDGETALTFMVKENDTWTSANTITVAANDSAVVYAIIYLAENGDQSSEMGAHYTGQFVFTSTADSNSSLTGTFTV